MWLGNFIIFSLLNFLSMFVVFLVDENHSKFKHQVILFFKLNKVLCF